MPGKSAINTRLAILWMTESQGVFAKNGIAVETIYLRSRSLRMTAMQRNIQRMRAALNPKVARIKRKE